MFIKENKIRFAASVVNTFDNKIFLLLQFITLILYLLKIMFAASVVNTFDNKIFLLLQFITLILYLLNAITKTSYFISCITVYHRVDTCVGELLSPRWYHTPSTQCFGTHMVYCICLLLQFIVPI